MRQLAGAEHELLLLWLAEGALEQLPKLGNQAAVLRTVIVQRSSLLLQ